LNVIEVFALVSVARNTVNHAAYAMPNNKRAFILKINSANDDSDDELKARHKKDIIPDVTQT
jgi:hypothetical protein